jgi:hypothetical protein
MEGRNDVAMEQLMYRAKPTATGALQAGHLVEDAYGVKSRTSGVKEEQD